MVVTKRNDSQWSIGLGAGLLCALLITPVRSEAALVNFNFGGPVQDAQGAMFTSGGSGANGFNTALGLSGNFIFNSTTPDVLSSDNTWGLYANPIQNLTVKVGDYTASFTPGSSVIQVIKNPGLGDTYRLTVSPLTGNAVNGQLPALFELELNNPNGNAFTNDHLPTTPPSLSSFASTQWRLVFNGVGNKVQGALTSLVPLPAAVWLFGAGLIALVGLGSRGLVRKDSQI